MRVHTFDTVQELRRAPIEFQPAYNGGWAIKRRGFRAPDAVRRNQLPPAAMAA